MVALSRLISYSKRAPELIASVRQTPAFADLVIRYLDVGCPNYPVNVPLRGGGMVSLSNAEEVKIFWQIFVRGCYPLPARCHTIIDAGANIGIFALWVARHAPDAHVLAIEPFPDTVRALRETVRNNHLEGQVSILELALAGQSGTGRMRGYADSPHRSLVLHGGPEKHAGTVTVGCATLEEVLERTGWETVDVLKMDIEGSEWEVLLGTPRSLLARIHSIMLEYHEVDAAFGYTPEKLFSHLASAGHRLTHREEDRYRTGLAYFTRD